MRTARHYDVTPSTTTYVNTRLSGDSAMYLLNEALALERMTDRHQRAVADERLYQVVVARRVRSARRLQRRADSASRRARMLMLSV
ncbi:MAG: hypothetical protein JO222_07655 [Frankiales bacterium]|nr:hypothetical protein [Frankiales bacterium]